MGNISQRIRVAIVYAALALIATLSAGCALMGTENTLQWEQVASGHLSGQRPGKLELGTHYLDGRTTVDWTSAAAGDASVRLTIRIENARGGYAHTESVLPGEPAAEGQASFRDIEPGRYHITFSQRFPRSEGPGYDFDVVVRTLR